MLDGGLRADVLGILRGRIRGCGIDLMRRGLGRAVGISILLLMGLDCVHGVSSHPICIGIRSCFHEN